ncbi:ABC transporter ATP-binding protein [Streptomyces roseolus]|uniref:ABC transporter ATP-binding protein n=1 Tax=Streptomyces roseolus TaxID=67358 RepID=UPI003F4D1FEF
MAFVAKHSPIWLLPLITAVILDVVVEHRPVAELWTATAVLLTILLLNFPLHLVYVRCMGTVVRGLGTMLRSALCARMQQLSIGYHSRTSASVLQAKVIRDAEAVEQMLTQCADLGLAAVVTLAGGLVVIGFRVPSFLPVFLIVVPAAGLLVMRLRGRLRSQNELFRRRMEQLSSRVGEMTSLIPITRAHGLEHAALGRVNASLNEVRSEGIRLDLLDGADMARLDLRSYRRFVSVVPQEPILFEGTIEENVTYGLRDVGRDAVRRALRDANALEFVDSLPHGVDTVVGERGARLSGGQKQRLAIARALVRDPRVLVLDEATSALDNHSEALIQQALSRLVRGRTVFVVAHRLSTIRDADRIIVMDRGRIAEAGTHDDLIGRGGPYTRMHTAKR